MPVHSEITRQDNETTEALRQAVSQVGTSADSFSEDINHLAARAKELADAIIQHGDTCPVGDAENYDDIECRLTHFVWAERAKHFLVLYRNVQLQLQTADLMVTDGAARAELVEDLHQRSRQTLATALEEWEAEVAQTRKRLESNEKFRRKTMAGWKLQHNPWPAYRLQILELAEQAGGLAEEFTTLNKQVSLFADIRSLLHESIAASTSAIAEARKKATTISDFIMKSEDEGNVSPSQIVSRLDEYIVEAKPPQQIHDYTNELNARIGKLVENIRVTVGADHGLMQFKDINFRRSSDQWISAEVLPQLYELWELSQQLVGGLDVAVNNVRNRSLLISNEIKAGQDIDYEVEDLSQPFLDFLERAENTMTTYEPIRENLVGLIDADLKLTSVYRPVPGFLPVPLQTGLNEFTRRQGRWLAPVKEWLGATFRGFERWRGDAAREDKMSVSEKVVRVINQRQVASGNDGYTNIVMTKGYIGESFLVGREAETAQLKRLVENWRKGYRGAVMLTGRRLSGRSLFGEMISNRIFPNNVIRLVSNGVISVEGRRMQTTGNLGEALSFVQKHTIQTRPMIWIDDLELWWDKDTSLAENVAALSAHIDSYSARIFYLVSTTNAVYSHLNRFRDLDRIFQAEVNLDNFSVEDTRRAIRIRHGATHKKLVDSEGEPLSETAFNHLVKRLHRASNGNVGDTLNRWAYMMEYCDEESVTPSQARRYRLPAFVNTDTGLLLTTLFLERRSNEYHLRKLFGQAFDRRYRSVLQRLLRVGLLTRSSDGWLSIRESVVTDVGRALENNGYLNNEL
ncbi:ATP-binding protein [Neolewinella aurantiaca]|uniref:ATP-binding protein n=1 Tax=Neolewinella aurantiaca TaxID=2602767 RepID=A0A5C7FR37_9BACT|nr:ATP-binding protein [Neolewinella aurantiaca]TXF87874.1 ATP-binding protein [Neolewinella aurantiaca]